MSRFLPALALAILTFPLSAQSHGDVWQFGYQTGIRFHECAPEVLMGGANAGFEGCSAISDASSGLLFYTNSSTVWNAQHAPMPNGTLVSNGISLSQVIIVRRPLSNTLYHIFTTMIQAGATGALQHHVVDMTLDGGLGDVASANNTLSALTIAEPITATTHANGTDVWVICHTYPSNTFLAWLVTSAGVATTPVVSNVGPAYASCTSNINARGELKFNLYGTRLALTANGVGSDDSTNGLTLFDFDPATGVVSAPLALPYGRGDFGVSFSPDGTKLYASTWKAFAFGASDVNTLRQFDLSSNDSTIIANSVQTLYSGPTSAALGSVQLAPDGRIYVARGNGDHIGVINFPDLAGTACDYQHNGLDLQGHTCAYGLNNYIQYVNCSIATDVKDPPREADELVVFPVPSDGLVTFSGIGIGTGAVRSVVFTEANGRVVMRSGATRTMDLSALPAGCYMALFLDEQGVRIHSTPLVITH